MLLIFANCYNLVPCVLNYIGPIFQVHRKISQFINSIISFEDVSLKLYVLTILILLKMSEL